MPTTPNMVHTAKHTVNANVLANRTEYAVRVADVVRRRSLSRRPGSAGPGAGSVPATRIRRSKESPSIRCTPHESIAGLHNEAASRNKHKCSRSQPGGHHAKPAATSEKVGRRAIRAPMMDSWEHLTKGEHAMDSIKPLFTAVGSVTGGRNGHGEAEDHSVSVNLSVPKAMGGPGRPNTTTPEHLFAVGYAACFGGALDFVAVQKKKNAKGATVTCSVSIGPRDGGGFGIAVKLHIKDTTLPQAELEAFAREAHEKICPYSHATRNNVPVELSVEGG